MLHDEMVRLRNVASPSRSQDLTATGINTLRHPSAERIRFQVPPIRSCARSLRVQTKAADGEISASRSPQAPVSRPSRWSCRFCFHGARVGKNSVTSLSHSSGESTELEISFVLFSVFSGQSRLSWETLPAQHRSGNDERDANPSVRTRRAPLQLCLNGDHAGFGSICDQARH